MSLILDASKLVKPLSFWDKVKIVMSDIWYFLEPFVKLFLTKSGQLLKDVALREVSALLSSSLTGEDKHKIAFNKIFYELKREGIDLGKSAINMAIEAALARLKS